jgi:hypothetical protein
MLAYLIELETINIFNTNTNKIILFKTAILAYEYALKLEPMIKRDIINTIDIAINSMIIWETTNNFPRYKCKLTPIDNDILWSVYMNDKTFQNRNVLTNIYTNLKINNIV